MPGLFKQPQEIFALLIAGSREYSDYREFAVITDHLLSQVQGKYRILIIEGEARGTDTLAKRYAAERGYALDPHPADWATYGKAAEPWRNEVMAAELELYNHRAALFFLDRGNRESRETANCVGEVKKRGIAYKIFDFRNKKFVK